MQPLLPLINDLLFEMKRQRLPNSLIELFLRLKLCILIVLKVRKAEIPNLSNHFTISITVGFRLCVS